MAVRARPWRRALRLGCAAGALLVAVPASRAEQAAAPPEARTRAECEAAGGAWDEVQGRGHVTGCNPRTADGGKACTDSDQCEGACQRGACTTHRFARGCGIVRQGRTLCVD